MNPFNDVADRGAILADPPVIHNPTAQLLAMLAVALAAFLLGLCV